MYHYQIFALPRITYVLDTHEIMAEISEFLQAALENPNSVEDADSFANSQENVINVTIPVQCLVEDQSKLILFEGSKGSLAGFYDPCSDDDKNLVVHYLYQGKHHQVVIRDEEPLRCPRLGHQLPNQ